MLLVRQAKLAPSAEQAQALRDTMAACNAAKNHVVKLAPRAGKIEARKLTYHHLRELFGLTAQMAVLAASDAAATRHHRVRCFRPNGFIAYDARMASIQQGELSISTLQGRLRIPFAEGSLRPERIDVQCRLVLREGAFFLQVPLEHAEPEVQPASEFLGVDLGIVNIAVDSDGEVHSGSEVQNVRRRHRRRRQKLQKKGTKSARRRLKRLRRKESRFARDVNHRLSKHLVDKAKGTGRGIALEDLQGIRERTTARRSQRSTLHAWSFHQLRLFVEYKASLAGVPVVCVDPRNTSRTCPLCGHCEKANRCTRDRFCCVVCGFAGAADHVAAENIRRAAVNRPIVAGLSA